MALQKNTHNAIETGVSRKQNFKRGNVSGKWVDKDYFRTRTDCQWMKDVYSDFLISHSKSAELFVLFSYNTPMAWYSLSDSCSKGTGKWYYVDDRYSASTGWHQAAYRMALKGENVVTLSAEVENESSFRLVMTEKECY